MREAAIGFLSLWVSAGILYWLAVCYKLSKDKEDGDDYYVWFSMIVLGFPISIMIGPILFIRSFNRKDK